MEYNFDSNDLAIFNRSLQLLHSPKIDSQRRLYHLMCQSIHKHHPASRKECGSKTMQHQLFTCGSSILKRPKDLYTETSTIAQSRATTFGLMQNSQALTTIAVNEFMNTHDPRQIQTEGLYFPSASKETQSNTFQNSASTNKSIVSTYLTSNKPLELPSSSASGKTLQGRVSKRPSHRPLSKNSTQHNFYPNAINLKKIRAVLARGDPFPNHLTKVCINNITPDLQREKL